MELNEQEQAIAELETGIDRLRALYEQYFMGLEKLEPLVPRKQVERQLQRLRRMPMRNTAQRFRFNQLVQRWNTMQNYWRRVARQIEEGTYRRDVMRARARVEQREKEEQQRRTEEERDAGRTHEVNLEEFEETNPDAYIPREYGGHLVVNEIPTILDSPPARAASQPSVAELLADSPPGIKQPRSGAVPPPPPPAALKKKPVSPAGTAPKELPSDRIQAIYRDYVSARQRCDQTTVGLTLEKVTKQIKKQEAVLRQKHGKSVDFEVSVRNGKAILKAVRRKE